MFVDFSTLSSVESYALMSTLIAPRPIAWVSTISADGITNLAPFSYFQGVTSSPPTLMFVPANDRHGIKKDTVRNIESVPEFVVNLLSPDLIPIADKTATRHPYGISEFELYGIATTPSIAIAPPRVSLAPVAFECRLDRIVVIGEGPLAANVVFGRILAAHLNDQYLGPDATLSRRLCPFVARAGSDYYSFDQSNQFGL
jgi:flavin reductase (DIM6/NTAB) family NADH-FMN oxidoreductase RutF